ncbi:MAG: crossover junction endodeoxyribonuclease RuvC [Candidatus Omnitrophica bacterium]|nr:crossover junction endodeoxyribonuclease RuvC [Candidatus Omnitrophota bacterium]
MVILGIDPALTITGYGVIEVHQRRIALIEAGVVKTSPRQVLTQRLSTIHAAISKLIHDTHPEVMVLEKLFSHYRHPTTAFLLGQARGVICLCCASAKIPLVEYAATRVKKTIVGKGLAAKSQVQRMVAITLGLHTVPRYTDVTDALALAIAHSHISRACIARGKEFSAYKR